MNYSPIEVAIALSLYAYNVSPGVRASKLWHEFNNRNLPCMEFPELVTILDRNSPYIITELPYPTAKLYVTQALEEYGQEAKGRVACESQVEILIPGDWP